MSMLLPLPYAGHWQVDGCWRPADWPQPEALLDAWTPGSQLWQTRAPDGWLLAWPAPQTHAVEALPGWAVRRIGNLWQSADFPAAARAGRDAGLLLVHGNALEHCTLAAFDPAVWLDLGALSVWTEPEPAADRVPDAPAPPAREARAVFKGLPAASAEREAVQRALAGGTAPATFWRRLARWLGAIPLGAPLAGMGAASTTGRTGAGRAAIRGSGWWERMLGALQRWSGLAGLVHRQHRRYLQQLLRSLAERDWQQFLRHALPLDDSAAAGPRRGLMQLLGPRAWLTYTAGGGGSNVSLATDFFQQMQQHYRRVFQVLDQAGQVDEAAYVLAELLRATDEAIAYLGKHDKHRTAAELGELRELPVARQVGLWLKAGERHRALALALRHQAFQGAVQQFDSDQPVRAQLRLLWGQHLLARGQVAQAVDVMWPEPGLRPQLTALLSAVETGDGADDTRLLARAVALLPERFETQWPAFQRLLARDEPGRALLKQFAGTLAAAQSTPATRLFARESWRALLVDRAAVPTDHQLLTQLLKHADDPYLHADQPLWPDPVANPQPAGPIVLAEAPRGSLDIRALAAVADGQLLVGLGEDGCLLVDGDGRIRRRWRTPANGFAGEPGGAIWLALQRRKPTLWAVESLDLVQGRPREARLWPLTVCAPRLVDGLWAVASVDRLRIQLLDLSSSPVHCVWDSGVLPSPVRALEFGNGGLAALLGGFSQPLQLWHWRWPGLALANRDTLELEAPPTLLLPEAGGTVLWLDSDAQRSGLTRLEPNRNMRTALPDLPGGCDLLIPVGEDIALAGAESGLTANPQSLLLERASGRVLLRWTGTATDGSDDVAAADARFLWIARDGAIARLERPTGALRWIVPG